MSVRQIAIVSIVLFGGWWGYTSLYPPNEPGKPEQNGRLPDKGDWCKAYYKRHPYKHFFGKKCPYEKYNKVPTMTPGTLGLNDKPHTPDPPPGSLPKKHKPDRGKWCHDYYKRHPYKKFFHKKCPYDKYNK